MHYFKYSSNLRNIFINTLFLNWQIECKCVVSVVQVYSRGRLLEHQDKNVNGVKSADFQFIVLRNMIPKANILAYFIDNDGTVTSDQIAFTVEGQRMENSVRISCKKSDCMVDIIISFKSNSKAMNRNWCNQKANKNGKYINITNRQNTMRTNC